MKITFRNQLNTLKKYANLFDHGSNETRLTSLRHLAAMPLTASTTLLPYFETLLFISAYPCDSLQLSLAQKELKRISVFLKQNKNTIPKGFQNSGLPFTPTITRFSHEGVQWLLSNPACLTSLEGFMEPILQLNDVLKHTLPSLEKSETSAGLGNFELLDSLRVSKQDRLHFIINELSRLDDRPYIKDQLFDSLDLYVRVNPKRNLFSKAFNRLPQTTTFFQKELLKKFDVAELLNSPLPPAVSYTDDAKADVISVIKTAMAITARETDPTTFMDEGSLRVFHLERGISIAIYGMIPSRQLPLESYIGYTAFKNGYPAAYGGAWVFGERSNFGINIFESFRNGESGYMMIQLLRVYRKVFGINYFEVEPFQFGLDNPDGIESGAYWFYYRFGFRSLSTTLRHLAETEQEKIRTTSGYRTSAKTLLRFTESGVALQLGQNIPPTVGDITSRVTKMIQNRYHGDRSLAEEDCRLKFISKSKTTATLNHAENQVLTEVSLWAEATHQKDPEKLSLLSRMITAKPYDVFAYQELLMRFLKN